MNRTITSKAIAFAAIAVGALGLTQAAQARTDVFLNIGIPVAPAYAQSQVYVEPAPVYVQPRPVYVEQRQVYVRPAPVVVYERDWRERRWHHQHERRWDERHERRY